MDILMQFQPISKQDYQDLIRNSSILKKRHDTPTVFLTKQQQIIKIFYPRKKFSLSALKPYAERFINNCKQLKRLGVKAPEVIQAYYLPEANYHITIYPKIKALPVSSLLKNNPKMLEPMLKFMIELHQKGIYFGDLIFSNILYKNQFYLIDTHRTKFYSQPLKLKQIIRNIKHLISDAESKAIIHHFGLENFLDLYIKCSDFNAKQAKKFKVILTACMHETPD